MNQTQPLKGPNRLVLSVLAASRKPLGAYDILAKLRTKGITGPPTVYRALEKLVSLGLAHRITSINSYIACHNEHGHTHEAASFAVCKSCKNVEEIHDKKLQSALRDVSAAHRFKVECEVVELVGLCLDCDERKGAA